MQLKVDYIILKNYLPNHKQIINMDSTHRYLLICIVLTFIIISSSFGIVTPKILSCIAGLQKCIGVPNIQSAKNWGCVVDEVTSCSGETEEKACGGCQSPLGIIHKLRCQLGMAQGILRPWFLEVSDLFFAP